MSDIGICKYCKHIDKDIIEKPCLHCGANLGAFEFDLSEHDKQIRAEAIEKIKESIKFRLIGELGLEGVRKYGNKNAKQQANSYATVMKYEIADCVDDLLDDLEQLKERKE